MYVRQPLFSRVSPVVVVRPPRHSQSDSEDEVATLTYVVIIIIGVSAAAAASASAVCDSIFIFSSWFSWLLLIALEPFVDSVGRELWRCLSQCLKGKKGGGGGLRKT